MIWLRFQFQTKKWLTQEPKTIKNANNSLYFTTISLRLCHPNGLADRRIQKCRNAHNSFCFTMSSLHFWRQNVLAGRRTQNGKNAHNSFWFYNEFTTFMASKSFDRQRNPKMKHMILFVLQWFGYVSGFKIKWLTQEPKNINNAHKIKQRKTKQNNIKLNRTKQN